MALSGTIRHPKNQPLGSLDEVKQRLTQVFPGIHFVLERGQGAVRPSGFNLGALLFRLAPPRYPYWEGSFQGDQFIATFNLGANPEVEMIRVTLYGRGTPNATPLFEELAADTGWKVSF